MLLLGRIRQHRYACPLILLCIVGNLIIMVFYVLSHGAQDNLSKPEELKDSNGIPLFLHEPLGNDAHRNSLKHPHPVRRSKINLRLNVAQYAELLDPTPAPRGSQVSSHEESDSDEKIKMKYHRNNIQNGHNNGESRILPDKLNDPSSQLKDKLVQKGMQVSSIIKHQMKPMNGGLVMSDTGYHLQGANSDNEALDFDTRGRSPDNLDPGTVKVLFSPTTLCEDNQDVYLLIAVVSDIQRFKLRNAIRRTWGRAAASGRFATKLLFVLGKPRDQDSPLNKMVVSENKYYNDILYLDVEDKYTLLTYKTLAMFQWTLEYCNQAKFIMKSDDDVFINIPNILQDLKLMQGKQPTRFMLGHVIQGAKPITNRQDKWFLPGGIFKGKTYPSYLSGVAYILPSILLEPIMQQSRETPIFWLEDVYVTGMLGKDVMATLIHSSKFEFTKRKLGPCRFKKLNCAHNLTPDDLLFVWREMNRMSLKCADIDGNFLSSEDY